MTVLRKAQCRALKLKFPMVKIGNRKQYHIPEEWQISSTCKDFQDATVIFPITSLFDSAAYPLQKLGRS